MNALDIRRKQLRGRLKTHTRRMLGAMLCWTALQAAAAQYEDGQARAQADTSARVAASRH